MVRITASRRKKIDIINKITDFYLDIWYERLINLTKRKYSYYQARRNILSVLTVFTKAFNDNQVKNTNIDYWKRQRWYEIQYKSWHFAVIIQLDLFGNNIAIVQDCIHDKDYHNDTMETAPFVMDSPDDKSHLVDWRERNVDNIIRESIYRYIRKNLLKKMQR